MTLSVWNGVTRFWLKYYRVVSEKDGFISSFSVCYRVLGWDIKPPTCLWHVHQRMTVGIKLLQIHRSISYLSSQGRSDSSGCRYSTFEGIWRNSNWSTVGCGFLNFPHCTIRLHKLGRLRSNSIYCIFRTMRCTSKAYFFSKNQSVPYILTNSDYEFCFIGTAPSTTVYPIMGKIIIVALGM